MRYSQRAALSVNPLAKKLFVLMDEKQTNLALSADVTHADDLIALAELLGPEICVLKTHIDILDDFTSSVTEKLTEIAERHQFLIFEDRKFADIGNTVRHQYADGIYHIADWAHLVNAHALPGPGIIKGLADIGLKKNRALLMLAEMSSEDNLLDPIYAEKTLEMAENFPDFVIGFISQRKLNDDPKWIYLTPGIQMTANNDSWGQQYITPESAILEKGTDIIIVGRGILDADDPLSVAKSYRDAGWKAYSRRK